MILAIDIVLFLAGGWQIGKWLELGVRYLCDRHPKPPAVTGYRIEHWNGCVTEYPATEEGRRAVLGSMLSCRPWHKRPRA